MDMKTRSAYSCLTDARKFMISAKGWLVEISNRKGMGVGECACSEGSSCAYHADLLNRIDELTKRAEGVLAELRADIADPERKH